MPLTLAWLPPLEPRDTPLYDAYGQSLGSSVKDKKAAELEIGGWRNRSPLRGLFLAAVGFKPMAKTAVCARGQYALSSPLRRQCWNDVY